MALERTTPDGMRERGSYDGRTRRQRYEQLRQELLTERASFDAHWQELGDYFRPRRIRFTVTDRNKGDRRNQKIINSTPVYAARTLQSGLHAGLTSPARPWMRLTTPDPELAEHPPVKQWLHVVTQRMLILFAQSNLYNALPTLYGDLGVFGTAAMAVIEDDQDLLRCYSYPIGSYTIGVDARGKTNTFVRDYMLTVRQVVDFFGRPAGSREIDRSRLSQQVLNAWDRGSYEAPIEICWIVTSNDEANPNRLAAAEYLPWRSCWFERGGKEDKFLRESGFRQFPVLAPRWDVTGEDSYGTDCPGMTTLPDNKSLQIMEKRQAKAVDKALDPPLKGPTSLMTQKTSLLPGDVTFVDVRDGQQGLSPIHEVRLEGVRELQAGIDRMEYRIQRGFFEDLFLMLATSDQTREGRQPFTAREVAERHEEKLIALGPVLERTNDELLDPLVDRWYDVMEHAGAIPEPPEALVGVTLKVEYVSILAQAQRLVGVGGQDRFLASTGSLIEAFPAARHKVNVFQTIDNYAEMLGVDPRIVRSDEDAQASLEAEQQAAAAQAQAEQLQAVAGSVKALGETPADGDTALRRVLGSVA